MITLCSTPLCIKANFILICTRGSNSLPWDVCVCVSGGGGGGKGMWDFRIKKSGDALCLAYGYNGSSLT